MRERIAWACVMLWAGQSAISNLQDADEAGFWIAVVAATAALVMLILPDGDRA